MSRGRYQDEEKERGDRRVSDLPAMGEHLREIVRADDVPERGLGREHDGGVVALHLEDRLGSVPDHPEGQGIHVNRHGVHGDGLFSAEIGCPDAGIHEAGYPVDEGKNQKNAGAAQPVVFSEPQDHRLLPVVGHLKDRGEEVP